MVKKNLDVDFYNYKILGAWNGPIAYKALLVEDKIGVMLPCNVIITKKVSGQMEVSAVYPIVSMQAIEITNSLILQQKLESVCKKSSGNYSSTTFLLHN
ncbi:MAG: DUF302 domain-containing protein [Ginsengibacter sp.]